jgi:hypothetical protein
MSSNTTIHRSSRSSSTKEEITEIKTKKNPGTRHGDEFGAHSRWSCRIIISQIEGSEGTIPIITSDQIMMEMVPSLPSICLTLGEVFLWIFLVFKPCRNFFFGGFKELRMFLSSGPIPLPFLQPNPLPWLALPDLRDPTPPLRSLWTELVVLLQEADDTTSLLKLLAQLIIRNALALGTEIFLEPQGIGLGDQKLMSFDLDGGTGIAKQQDLSRQPNGVVNWRK